MAYRVGVVDAARTYALRRDVLRPNLSLEEVAAADVAAVTFAALDAVDDSVLSCASLLEEPPPPAVPAPPSASARAHRIRFMATQAERRGEGVGSAVLERLIEEVAANGGGLLWCNAREGAVRFYERAGFAIAGDRFIEEGIGPHFVMWRLVSPDPQP